MNSANKLPIYKLFHKIAVLHSWSNSLKNSNIIISTVVIYWARCIISIVSLDTTFLTAHHVGYVETCKSFCNISSTIHHDLFHFSVKISDFKDDTGGTTEMKSNIKDSKISSKHTLWKEFKYGKTRIRKNSVFGHLRVV